MDEQYRVVGKLYCDSTVRRTTVVLGTFATLEAVASFLLGQPDLEADETITIEPEGSTR